MDNERQFSYSEHQEFLRRLESSEDRKYYAVYNNEGLIGSVCLNPFFKYERIGEIGKFVLSHLIGKGYGKKITIAFLDYCFEHNLLNAVYAKTKRNNIRNIKINLSLGYQIYANDDTYIYMKLLKNRYVK